MLAHHLNKPWPKLPTYGPHQNGPMKNAAHHRSMNVRIKAGSVRSGWVIWGIYFHWALVHSWTLVREGVGDARYVGFCFYNPHPPEITHILPFSHYLTRYPHIPTRNTYFWVELLGFLWFMLTPIFAGLVLTAKISRIKMLNQQV